MRFNKKNYILNNKQPRKCFSCGTRYPICGFLRARRISFLWLLILLLLVVCILGMLCDLCKAKDKKEKNIIVIDAGHGGNDPGMVAGNVLEKDVNLSIARKLQHKLIENGYTVVMTREEDACLALDGARNKKISDLKQRVEIINQSNANLLISIHQNCYKDETVRGAQTFFYGASEQSEKFARLLQANMIAMVDADNHRQARDGRDYYLLRKSVCPGVILECGFLSCPSECVRLVDDTYQNKIVDAIVKSVDEYY